MIWILSTQFKSELMCCLSWDHVGKTWIQDQALVWKWKLPILDSEIKYWSENQKCPYWIARSSVSRWKTGFKSLSGVKWTVELKKTSFSIFFFFLFNVFSIHEAVSIIYLYA